MGHKAIFLQNFFLCENILGSLGVGEMLDADIRVGGNGVEVDVGNLLLFNEGTNGGVLTQEELVLTKARTSSAR